MTVEITLMASVDVSRSSLVLSDPRCSSHPGLSIHAPNALRYDILMLILRKTPLKYVARKRLRTKSANKVNYRQGDQKKIAKCL